jgi:hypothetical protein
VHGVSSSIVATHDYDWIGIDLQCEIVAPFRDFAGMTGEKPATPPNLVNVAPIDFLGRVKLARQRPAGSAALKERVEALF